MRRPPPTLGLAAALLGAASVPATASAEFTAEVCADDHAAYVAQAESNRIQRITQLTAAIDAIDDPDLRERFAAEREQAWQLEEERRGQATAIYRECMQYVRKLQSRAD